MNALPSHIGAAVEAPIIEAIRMPGISDAERKERIMLARQCGMLSDEAAEDLIIVWGLASA